MQGKKYRHGLMIIFLMSGCSLSAQESSLNTSFDSLTGAWQLQSMAGVDNLTNHRAKIRFIQNKDGSLKINGSDGCNQIFAQVERVDNKNLQFSPMSQTKMLCIDMSVSDKISTVLSQVEYYRLEDNILYFLDKDQKVVSQWLSVTN